MCKIITPEYELELNYPPFEKMTDNELLHFCEQNRDIRIERDEHSQLFFMPPITPYISSINSSLTGEVNIWNRIIKSGRAFDSSAGFFLSDTSMRSPDVSWIKNESWQTLTNDQRKGFAYITPDFVIELVSPLDRMFKMQDRMKMWRSNGVRLGWLIDPETETVFIYRINGTISKVEGFNNTLSGEDVLPGFEFGLAVLR